MNALAVLSGSTVVNAVIWLIIAGLIFWLLGWLVDYCAIGEPFNKIAKVVIAIVAVLLVINALLSIAGRAFIVF
jgi:hypothetical protein